MQGISLAECGVLVGTDYSTEEVQPIAGSFEEDGSGFLLWERKASYAVDGKEHLEDVCGVTYVQIEDGSATIIATFRQPTPVCTLR
jgi:hypothetical protein